MCDQKARKRGKTENQTRNPKLPKNCKIFCHPRKADILRKIEEIVGHMERGGGGGVMIDDIVMLFSGSFP